MRNLVAMAQLATDIAIASYLLYKPAPVATGVHVTTAMTSAQRKSRRPIFAAVGSNLAKL